jgi:hypothetical protein
MSDTKRGIDLERPESRRGSAGYRIGNTDQLNTAKVARTVQIRTILSLPGQRARARGSLRWRDVLHGFRLQLLQLLVGEAADEPCLPGWRRLSIQAPAEVSRSIISPPARIGKEALPRACGPCRRKLWPAVSVGRRRR